MKTDERLEHWQRVYTSKRATEVSWYQPEAITSHEMIERAGLPAHSSLIDVGGGASTLIDALLERYDVTVLDISGAALQQARDRLGTNADRVTWLVADITQADLPEQRYDLWHDRAVFHFLTNTDDRSSYLTALRGSLKPGGFLLLATFAPDGPIKCSGLEVVRYNAKQMLEVLGEEFRLLEERFETHVTPSGGEQRFVYALFGYRSS
jgi:ubiquinone/menaquinone biosynthesis C-methylase UbiE